MEHYFQPTVLFPIAVVVIALGSVITSALRKTREKELQCHQDLRIREMEHELKMKQLEIELEKTKGRSAEAKVA